MSRPPHLIKKATLASLAMLALHASDPLQAGCCDHASESSYDNAATLIIEARVINTTSSRLANQKIVTDVTLQPIEVFKGDIEDSAPFTVRLPGGTFGNETQDCSQHLTLIKGQDYILRLIQKNNHWRCLEIVAHRASKASEPKRKKYRSARISKGKKSRRIKLASETPTAVQQNKSTEPSPAANSQNQASSVATAAGYYNINGAPARFTICDDGSPMLYIVDSETLPSGISQAEALQAVQEALAAWTAASGLTFKHEGNIHFGEPAGDVSASDQKLRIQLHDKYNDIASITTLGIGGGSYTYSGSFPNGGLGANVAGQEFQKRTRGYCTLNHRSTSMQTYSTFVEVLTHEIGHALGLRHSSESPGETDPILKDAIMYYRAHGSGRGATLETYDTDLINYGYPSANMPPHGTDRIFYPITGDPQPTGVGADRLTITGGDQETPDSLTTQILLGSASSTNGTFSSPDSSTIVFTPAGVYNPDFSLTQSQIDNNSYYDFIHYRISDGVNMSPHYSARIVGMKYDSTPSDGLPDSWMTANFGTTSVATAGQDHHPASDPDGDGLNNRIEFLYGTDPNLASSGKANFAYNHTSRATTWDTINHMPYILECSNDMSTWSTIRVTTGTGSSQSIDIDSTSELKQFYRVRFQP